MGYSPEKLEALALEKLAREPGTYSDGGGLRLTVRSRTSRSWVFSYTLNHSLRSIGLGPYPKVTLAMAREQAAEVRRLVKANRDPHEAWAVARATGRVKAAEPMTFRRCAEKMHAHRTHDGKRTAQWLITSSTYAFPVIGDLPVATINTGLVLKVLEPIWAGRPQTASRLRGRIENVLDWAKARGYRNGKNPARWRGHLEHFLPAAANVQKVGHHAALPFDQIPHFMTVLRAQKGIAARALEFLILTVGRRDEVIGARWDEIDKGAKIWIVPAERMKGGREHRVPLSARAIEILEETKNDGGFVFSGGHRQLGAAMFRLLRRLRDGPTEQGFRFTFREWATERASFPPEAAEIALGHTVGDKLEAAYGRDELIDEQRELMDAWAAACSGRAFRSTKTWSRRAGLQR
jgi:integrase